MKNSLLFVGLLAIANCALAESAERLRSEIRLKVADAYTQCGAYYEIARSVREAINNIGNDDAVAMKEESMAMAVSIASVSEGTRKGRKFADDGFAKAIEDMHASITSDPEAFRQWAEDTRRDCRMAVTDPPTFMARKLAELTGTPRKSIFASVPKDLTVQKILKHGTPTTAQPVTGKCEAQGKEVTLSLDEVPVEGGMVCAQHHDGVCAGERHWMSYRQYISSQFPSHDFDGYTQTYSVTFKNGQRQDKRTLTACLLLPEATT